MSKNATANTISVRSRERIATGKSQQDPRETQSTAWSYRMQYRKMWWLSTGLNDFQRESDKLMEEEKYFNGY